MRGGGRGGIQFVLLGSEYEEIYAAARVYADAIRERLDSVENPRIDYTPSQAQVAIKLTESDSRISTYPSMNWLRHYASWLMAFGSSI